MDCVTEESSSELSSHTEASEHGTSPEKASSQKLSIQPQDQDTTTSADEEQEKGKCQIKKDKNLRTYAKRKKKKQRLNKSDNAKSPVTIKTCTKREDDKRAWDKRHYCLYCGQSHSKIARHLQRKHMEIKDVAYAFSFQPGSKERNALLEQLRIKGDLKHNAKVLEEGTGQLVTWKQPSDNVTSSPKDHWPCPYCYGMFVKRDLWRHRSIHWCKKSCVKDGTEKKRGQVQSLAARLLPIAAIRGCDCLRKYAEESKAENPELLRSTKLRKQVARLCQHLDLSEQELEQIARFMGHDIRVHYDFYRQTDKTFEITKINKLLFPMEQGTGTLAGKNLTTIDPSLSGMYELKLVLSGTVFL